tara:strand:+ start:2788 stop:2949 length:162 start_codon:yes stop_codon:yes gene_type:complete
MSGFKKQPTTMRELKRGVWARMKAGESFEYMIAHYPREVQVEVAEWIKKKVDG